LIALVDRYVLRETIVPLTIGAGAVVIMWIGTLLFDNARWFFAYKVPLIVIAQLIIYHTPSLLVRGLAVGTAVAVSLAVNRLARDSEITVMRMSGISLRRIFRSLMLLGLFLSGFSFWLNEYVVPNAEQQFMRIQQQIFMTPTITAAANVVFKLPPYVIAIGSVQQENNRIHLQDVWVIERAVEGWWLFTHAENGYYEAGLWRLPHPIVHRFENDVLRAIDMKAPELLINQRVAVQDFFNTTQPEVMSRRQLGQQIRDRRKAGLETRSLEMDYHMKLSLPAACFILAICSPVLSIRFARSGTFAGVLLSIIVVFVFWNTILLFQILGSQGLLPTFAAAWSPHVLFALMGLFLLWRSE
jgi:lipopolysaccharide export system permease protein